jgi:tetratricopeptide (TPR) repeat protein
MLGLPVTLLSWPQSNAPGSGLPSSQALFERGKEYLQEGRFDRAVATFAELLKASPDSPVLYNLIGYCDLQRDLRDDAVANFKKAVALNPDYEAAHSNLGGIYLLETRFAEAADEFRAVIRIDPHNAQAYYDLARAQFGSRQWQSGLEHLQTAYGLAPGSFPIGLALATYDVEHGQKESARSVLQKLVTIAPADATSQLQIGTLFLKDDMQDAAMTHFENAMRQDPQSGRVLLALAREDAKEQHYESALQILQIARASTENSAAWHEVAGEAYLKLGRPEEAAEEFQKVIGLEPGNVDGILQLGEVFVANNDSPAAAALFGAAVKFLPRSPRVWFGLGVAYLGETRYNDAVKSLETSLELDPKLEPAYVVLSLGYSEAGQWNLVQKTAKRLIVLNPQNSMGYYYEAVALLRSDSSGAPNDEAEKLLRRSMSLDEQNPEPRYELVKLLLREGKKQAAFQELQRIALAAPDFAPAHYELFRFYRGAGQAELSEKELKTFQRLSAKETAESMRRMLVEVRQPSASKQ